jgi:hypothetical protein
MLGFNKIVIDVQLLVQRPVVRVFPHRAVAGVIYYHLEVCNSLPNFKWANSQASELPWFGTRCMAIKDEQPNITT